MHKKEIIVTEGQPGRSIRAPMEETVEALGLYLLGGLRITKDYCFFVLRWVGKGTGPPLVGLVTRTGG